MAERKTLKFLPNIFQTDVNDKFLSATLDQLVSEPNLKTINGYIGRKFAPTYKAKDSYIVEDTQDRQDYQLEPSIVVRDDSGKITFFASYIDLLNKIKYYGGLIDNHDRLFSNEFYSYDPKISFDKFVNFTQYYWLPNGPDAVSVNTSGVELTQTFTVTRDIANNRYIFSNGDGTVSDNLTLARGGVYEFIVNQPGVPFWIQVEPGKDGLINATPTISNREVMGVENNGIDVGTITFSVQQSDAQQRFINMPVVYNVDYATPFNTLPYKNLHNKLRSQFLEAYPQYAGITAQLDGKYLIFVDQTLANDFGEEAWTAGDVVDNDGNVITGWGVGEVVPDNQRSGVWKVMLIDIGIANDPLIRLVPVQDVAVNEKVYVKYGLVNANREFYKDYDTFFYRAPVISTVQDTLYFQDAESAGLYGEFKIVEYAGWSINVETDILGKTYYTSPNGVKFSSGLKISFDTDVTPASYQNNTYYVENVGDSIRLVDVNLLVTPEAYNAELALNYPDKSFPDYITINRCHPSLNAWSRNNRWFHRDVIIDTAAYNNVIPVFDQTLRAQRPIIQFEGDLQLFNDGRIGKKQIDILDTTTTDAFNQLEGEILDTAFGVTLYDGMRVLFAADNDPLVRDKIFVVNLVQYELDSQELPTGPIHVKLTLADDGDNSPWDSVVVMSGQYEGSQWWYDGSVWHESQQKTALNQEPLFDVFDSNGQSLSSYNRSTFKGTRVFGYKRKSTLVFDGVNTSYIDETGTPDSVLGFTLNYRNFGTQGDIEFNNYFDNESFDYVIDQTVYNPLVSTGFLYSIIDRDNVSPKNVWRTVVEESKQYQNLVFTYAGVDSFNIDILPEGESSIPYTKVYVNNRLFKNWYIDSTNKKLVISDSSTLVAGDKIDALIYSISSSAEGYYQIPLNLDLNAQNITLDTLTLGQIRNHLVELSHNSTQIIGDVLSASNLRDLEIKQQGGNILKHSAPVSYASLFLLDDTANFVDSVRFAQREYAKFKNKFLELSSGLPGVQPTDPVTSVDLILTEINKIKNSSFPWFYSDMVPYGPLKTVVADGYTVFDPLVRTYEITNVFSSVTLSNQAVLVYVNDVQLILDLDYYFETDRPAVTFNPNVTLAVDDIIKIVEYSNTDGNYIPETPSKLGLYPKYAPVMFEDDTYRTPITVIRGHDGSITPAFNDYRDDILLELEKRIYNNIKLPDVSSFQDIFSVVPGKFRKTEYTLAEMNRLLSKGFLSWIGNNKLDYSSNTTFQSNDLFTWNYGNFVDRIDGEYLPGNWRACYQYFYDTDAPHMRPWEMLGFTAMPDWWVDYYGEAPYTGGNKLLWEDLEEGRIVGGFRSQIDVGYGMGIDPNYARPGLSQVIPVDENGGLLSPAAMMAKGYDASRANSSWAIGQQGPVESAWRRSSDFPYAAQIALALAKPSKYFGLCIDTYNYRRNYDINQILTSGNHQLHQTDATFNGDRSSGTTVRASGYLNWIADHLINRGINPSTKITAMLKNYSVNLAYKMSGFTDQGYVQVLAEQSSPTSTNDSIVIPSENYKVHLYKSTPVDRISLSAVIVEKTSTGYVVKGYDLSNPYFTIIPSIVNSNATRIKVLDAEAVAYNDYQLLKLTVPYGYEFKSRQQLADFLICYERFLIAQGFTFNDFDEEMAEIRNWKLSIKEFLFWSQQGWKPGSILVLNPIADTVKVITSGAITDTVTDDQYGSKVLDQNFKLVKNNNYEVMRTPTYFKLSLSNSQIIGLIELNLVQFEHVLVFDNTTVFNDIIYKPELGNRQYRLKLIGQKTGAWDGSLHAPGFIYNTGDVDSWKSGKDYLKGDLVEFKNQYYVAINNVVASDQFDFSQWMVADYGQISKGLLSNFSSIAVKGQSSYDPYGYFNDADQIKYSHGLIGFKPRGYLDDLAINETSQIEFYKGYIKQKGSANAFDALTKAEFNNLASDITYFEEWAVRIGEYGAVDVNPYVEIALDEKAFSVNPALAEFVDDTRRNEANGVNMFNSTQLHKLTDQYTGNIALNRDDASDFTHDILTAGYVNIDDVDATVFDMAEYSSLNTSLSDIGNGYTIWTAKDFTGDWNVYRITETDNDIVTVTNALNGYITFTSRVPHELSMYDVFMVRNFDTAFDGFYQVTAIVDINNVTVKYSGDTTELSSQQGDGRLFRLDSLRFTYMEDARLYHPPHGWKAGEKIWIDDDAATSTVQGQPLNTGTHLWKVYEKHMPWNVRQSLDKQPDEYATNDGFGTDAKLSLDGTLSVVSSPLSGDGRVTIFAKDKASDFTEAAILSPKATNTSEFGTSINLSIDRLAVGAPGSNSDNGYVYIYKKYENIPNYEVKQVIAGNLSATGERFGHSVVLDEHGEWLYVGAPDADRVYVYGLNKFVSEGSQASSVNNRNTVTLTGNVAVTAGTDYIYQPDTGAYVQVLETSASTNVVVVSSLTNINLVANIEVVHTNFYGDAIGTSTYSGVHPSGVNSTATITSIQVTDFDVDFDFIPEISSGRLDASAFVVTTRDRTYIPEYDYKITSNASGVFVDFITAGNVSLPATVAQNDVDIKQGPYYKLTKTIQGPTGSEFGYCVDSSYDGAQLAVGTPGDTVNVAVMSDGISKSVAVGTATAGVVSYKEFQNAGSVFVYDRVIEAFNSTGNQDYQTQGVLGEVYKVTIDQVEVPRTEYHKIGNDTIRFITPPDVGKVVYIETNVFNLLEKLIGINNLYGGLSAIQSGARFGTDLTICSNNCAIYVGAPYYDNGTTYNTGAVWKFHSRGRLYGTNTGYTLNPEFTPNDTIRLDNFEVRVNLGLTGNVTVNAGDVITQPSTGANVTVTESTTGNYIQISDYANSNVFNTTSGNIYINGSDASVRPRLSSLDEFVGDINNANLLGISAVNYGGYLQINSDSTVAKNLLRILSGRNISANAEGVSNIYSAADMAIFAFMQIIINPYNTPGEYFGNRVILARNAYMLVIGSQRGTTKKYTTFDEATTTLDSDSTAFFDSIYGSGSVYIYELYDDPRDQVENPGRYAFAQQLNPGDLNTGDMFGAAVDIVGSTIIVSSPGDDTTLTDAGTVYIFENPNRTRGWNLIRYQQPKVDIDSVNRLFLYNKNTNSILTNLEFIDPAKGKVPGLAEQEINYKTAYDPAKYNVGTNSRATIDPDLYWGPAQVGQVWWDLDRVRYVDYEQDTLTYRSINWGKLFPGSKIDVLEWTASDVLPSEYTTRYPNAGTPKYADDSAYVEVLYVDSLTNLITSKYYFWVGDKPELDSTLEGRKLPVSTIKSIIENPKAQGLAYAAIIQSNTLITYNVGQYLSASDTILHVDYELIKNESIIHSEYELIQKGNPLSFVPEKISNKLIDSLSGIDALGRIVPDPKLSVADQLGVGFRPRQSMFVDRTNALKDFVGYVNSILKAKPIARQYDLTTLLTEEPKPNFKLGEYDQSIATEEALLYIDTAELAEGYRILVENDTTQNNLWVLYTLDANKQWVINRVQAYKTSLYWDYVDWYADGFDDATQIDFAVPTLIDALKLQAQPGSEILVRIATGALGFGGWNLLVITETGGYSVVGIEKGTIQLKDSIGNFADNELGFGNQGYDMGRLDQNPNKEIRYIVQALKDDIFINELDDQYNKLFFVMINYLFGEQKYVDWIFKTSFISVTHSLRELNQFPNYIKDNQTYYQEYINEVKPYATKIREYQVGYNSLDNFDGDITDFDVPPYYDANTNIFRSPSGERAYLTQDASRWQTGVYTQWYQNRNHQIDSIIVVDAGSGYTSIPTVTITSGGKAVVQATARATIDYDTGEVTGIVVMTPGSGYYETPVVTINGSCTIPARAYAVLKSNQVRSLNTTIKFDRTTYSSSVLDWQANTSYVEGDILSYNGIGYLVTANITTGTSFVASDYTVVDPATFENASDRIMAYYAPSESMPARDLKQLMAGIDYPGVQVTGLGFNKQPGFDNGGLFDDLIFDPIAYDEDGNPTLSDSTVDAAISSTYLDTSLGLRPEDIDVDGGAYVDTYSSHAPEELIPGIVYEAVDMKVYTKIDNDVILGHRVFNRSYSIVDPTDSTKTVIVTDTSYSRIADKYSTLLAQDLHITDTEIVVVDATKCPVPSPSTPIPGVVFINGERITYWTVDYATNKLGQIRRGTLSTAAPEVHVAGTLVVDASLDQEVPSVTTGLTTGSNLEVTSTGLSYRLKLTGNVSANVGDIITQSTNGANLLVVGRDRVDVDTIWVTYNSGTIDYATVELEFSSNLTIFAGDTVSQLTSNASLTVSNTVYDDINVELIYNTLEPLDLNGNLYVNGVDSGFTIANVTFNPNTTSNLAINGTYTGDVYPVAIDQLGELSSSGTVTIGAGNIYTQSWYTSSGYTATDGTGFNGATTDQVLFLKEEPASYTVGIAAEDTVNILSILLTTEDDELIIEE